MRSLLFLLLLGSLASALTLISQWNTPSSFSSEVLFSKLDSVGKNGNWMQWDSTAITDRVMIEVEKKERKVLARWILKEPVGSYLLATLSQVPKGERLAVYRFKELNTTPEQLSVHSTLNSERLFLDYKQISGTEFEHLDNPNLKITAFPNRIRFIYSNPDSAPLFFSLDYKTMSTVEKKDLVDQYMTFFEYEYSLMLRSFIQSTRGVFNWQPWHWYSSSWTQGMRLSRHEVSAILEKGVAPSSFRLFYNKTKKGEIVRFNTNGNGSYEMEIIFPD